MDHQKFAQCAKDARTEKGLTQRELGHVFMYRTWRYQNGSVGSVFRT